MASRDESTQKSAPTAESSRLNNRQVTNYGTLSGNQHGLSALTTKQESYRYLLHEIFPTCFNISEALVEISRLPHQKYLDVIIYVERAWELYEKIENAKAYDLRRERALTIQLLPWQQDVLGKFMSQTTQEVLIIIDSIGDTGKSYMAETLVDRMGGSYVHLESNQKADIDYVLSQSLRSTYFHFDLPKAGQVLHFDMIETLKKKKFVNSKDNSRICHFVKQPLVLITMNTMPALGDLSYDRILLGELYKERDTDTRDQIKVHYWKPTRHEYRIAKTTGGYPMVVCNRGIHVKKFTKCWCETEVGIKTYGPVNKVVVSKENNNERKAAKVVSASSTLLPNPDPLPENDYYAAFTKIKQNKTQKEYAAAFMNVKLSKSPVDKKKIFKENIFKGKSSISKTLFSNCSITSSPDEEIEMTTIAVPLGMTNNKNHAVYCSGPHDSCQDFDVDVTCGTCVMCECNCSATCFRDTTPDECPTLAAYCDPKRETGCQYSDNTQTFFVEPVYLDPADDETLNSVCTKLKPD